MFLAPTTSLSHSKRVAGKVLLAVLALIAMVSVNAYAGDIVKCSELKKSEFTTIADQALICKKGHKIRFYTNFGFMQGNYLELDKPQVEEVDPDGRVVRTHKLKVDKNSDWSVTKNNSVYSLTYVGTDKTNAKDKMSPATVTMSLDLGILIESTIFSNMPCTNCTRGSGSCMNVSNGSCRASTSYGTCGRRFTMCSMTVDTEKDILSISLNVSGWDFQQAENRLRLDLDLKTSRDKDIFETSKNDWKELNLIDSGLLDLKNEATVSGPDQNQYVIPASVVVVSKNKSTGIEIEFDAYLTDYRLKYGPRN